MVVKQAENQLSMYKYFMSQIFTLKESKMVGDEVCHCIRDVENNGVVRMLRLVALKVRLFLVDKNLRF